MLPQFHCIYDNAFGTVHNDAEFQSLWQKKPKLQPHAETNSVNQLPTDPMLEQDNTNLPSHRDQTIPMHLHQPWHAVQQRDHDQINCTIPTLCANMPELRLMRESAPAHRQLRHDY